MNLRELKAKARPLLNKRAAIHHPNSHGDPLNAFGVIQKVGWRYITIGMASMIATHPIIVRIPLAIISDVTEA